MIISKSSEVWFNNLHVPNVQPPPYKQGYCHFSFQLLVITTLLVSVTVFVIMLKPSSTLVTPVYRVSNIVQLEH